MTRLRQRDLVVSFLTLLAAVCVALVASAGARADGGGGATPTGPNTGTRPAPIVYRPAGLSVATKVPLLVALYGTQGCPQCMEGLTHFEAVARQYGFVVAYPGSALVNGSPWQSSGDIPYISSLISQIESSQNIDPTRVYVIGFSAGGRFAYQLGCALSRQITAIASVGSVQRPYTCPLTHPVSELSIMGSKENWLVNGYAPRGIPSAATVEGWWRHRNGCTTTISASSVAPLSQQASGSCVDGSRVALYIVQGGHHTWPGCSCKLPSTDPDSQWNASTGIWAFMSGLRTGSLTTPDASFLGVRFQVAAHHKRRLKETYALQETVKVTETLLVRGHKPIKATATIAAGRQTVYLTLPGKLKPGTYKLKLQITDLYGRTLTVQRKVHVGS